MDAIGHGTVLSAAASGGQCFQWRDQFSGYAPEVALGWADPAL